jgi:zinc-dependent metalloproteinase lipoprotein
MFKIENKLTIMKKNHIFKAILAGMAVLLMAACNDDPDIITSQLEVDKTTIDAPAEGLQTTLLVNSNVRWTITSAQGWTTPDVSEGVGNHTLTLTIPENYFRDVRSDTLTVATVDGTQIRQVIVSQNTFTGLDDHFTYKIPVVFHVIYRDANNEKQNLRQGYLKEVLAGVNRIWKEAAQGINVEFVAATEMPNGAKLEEPGVNRVKWDIDKIDYNRFMGFTSAAPKRYRDLLWDQNRYVNICLYNFSDENITGVTTLPYTLAPDTLPGLEKLPANISPKELTSSLCISINSANAYTTPDDNLQTTNFVSTVAHELGHYLGLRHVFGEDDSNGIDYNGDSDFCEDTPTYNRNRYLSKLSFYEYEHPNFTNADVTLWLERTNSITGEKFTSDNIMDYYWTLRNKFTTEQVKRIRYVLMHSPFVPGPKVRTAAQAKVSKRYFNVPVRPAICDHTLH